MNENMNRVWRPVVEPNRNALPSPSSLNNQNLKSTVYTKTSLASSQTYSIGQDSKEQSLENKIKQYNREVLTATQSFNNSPKPFKGPNSSAAVQDNNNFSTANATKSSYEVSSHSSPIVLSTSNKNNNNNQTDIHKHCSTLLSSTIKRIPDEAKQQHQAQLKFTSQLSQVAELSDSSSGSGIYVTTNQQQPKPEQQHQQEENMAPKLVHKQYNSPIDLYSMNNIRKTIEAHTELIAPGLKGINFMKPDTPVNKQSEVYKLVMEEERAASHHHQQQQGFSASAASSSSRLSPISGQPISGTRQAGIMIQDHHQQQQQQQHQMQHQQNQEPPARQQQPTTISPTRAPQSLPQQQPGCCECGQLIVGPFARIGQNRCIHPQCFNCTTCGTSLKNIGYFTVNDKLYCEIHAKQVANIMRIKYDFGGVSQKQENHSTLQQQSSNQRLLTSNQQQQERVTSRGSNEQMGNQQQQPTQFKAYASSSSPATISTMFADRSNSVLTSAEATSAGSGEVRWTWRPMTSKERCNTSASTSTCLQAPTSSHSSTSTTSQQQYSQQGQHYQQKRQENQQQSIGVRGRGLLQAEGSLIGGQIPICIHCNTQIHGPYILAGKTTWCKSCSQNHFNCHSCKRSLLEIGFIEDNFHKYYCEHCFEAYHAPICFKCNIRIKGDCLNALKKQWHPSCFVCGHCRRPFGNSSFYLEDNVPYCERDWNLLFTTKCFSCSYPIQAGDKWIEALDRNYHSNCFRCSSCQTNLEGSTFYCKNNKPYCRLHAR